MAMGMATMAMVMVMAMVMAMGMVDAGKIMPRRSPGS